MMPLTPARYAIVRHVTLASLILAIVAFSLVLLQPGTRDDPDEPVHVIPGVGAAPRPVATQERSPAAPVGRDTTSAGLGAFVASSFPSLRDVAVRCSGRQCEISAITSLPLGPDHLASYEEMVRTGLGAALKQRGYALTEATQIEEISGEDVRLRIHAAS
jgi:hypothetical protein